MHRDGIHLIIICSILAASLYAIWRRGVAKHGGVQRPVDFALHLLKDDDESNGNGDRSGNSSAIKKP